MSSWLGRLTSLLTPKTKNDRSLQAHGLAGFPIYYNAKSSSGVNVTPDTALAFSAVYACVQVIANNIATLPFSVYQRTDQGRTLAVDHHQFHLLRREPSPLYHSANFRKALIANYLLQGDGYARIYRDQAGHPTEYRICQPAQITPFGVKGESGQVVDIYYKDLTTHEIISSIDMIHISDFTQDGIKGRSKISIARDSIGMALASTEFGSKFYENGTFLGGYIKTDKTLTPESAQRLRKSFKEIYTGPDHIGDIATLEEGAEFKQYDYSMPMTDAQFIQSRQFQVEEIARIFGVPPHKIGHLNKSSFNNIEQQNVEFVENCMRPITTLIEMEFDRKVFFTDTQYFTRIEMKGLLRGDIKTRSEFYQKMFDRGVFSINDIRRLEDMNDIDQGDHRFVPLNMLPLDHVDEYLDILRKTGPSKTNDDQSQKTKTDE